MKGKRRITKKDQTKLYELHINKKQFLKVMFDTIRNSEFMDSVLVELIEMYAENTDEQNELDFDDTMLPEMLNRCVEMEWYEIAARIHKQITKLQSDVKNG